jgi:methyl-accepting chemotaxis protein
VQVEGLFSQLEDFMEKNPVNGAEMMKKAMEVVNIAHGLKRMDVWLVSRASYGEIIKIYNTYDADGQLQMTPISDWTRATDQFLSMSNLHSGNEIDCNLKNYYKLYIDMMKLQVEENAKRVAEYNQKKAEAEAEAAAKKAVKVGIMSVGGWAVLIGAAVVILIALLLLMFNIQRTLLRMKEMMEQGQGPKASSAPVDTPDEKK